MDRRRFLWSSLGLVGARIIYPRTARAADEIGAGSSDDGFPDIVRVKGEARAATRRAIDAIGGMERFVKPGQVVLVKPNAGFDSPPEWGASTHPEVLAGVLDACIAAQARRILVVDHTLAPSQRCFQRTGLNRAVADYPTVKLVALDDPKTYVETPIPLGQALKTTQVAAVVGKVDVFINVPTAKAHSATEVSLGLKNLMGLVWDRHVFHQGMDLHVGIADLATVLRPHLTILDAIHILKTGGPTGPGEVEEANVVIAGVDPVAVDAVGVGLSTWNRETLTPDAVGYIRHAAARGLGSMRLDTLRIVDLT